MIPCSLRQGRESGKLMVPFGGRFNKGNVARLGLNDQGTIGHRELSMSVTTALPLTLSRHHVDADQDFLVQAIDEAIVQGSTTYLTLLSFNDRYGGELLRPVDPSFRKQLAMRLDAKKKADKLISEGKSEASGSDETSPTTGV